jgi:hypothetical protein
VPAPSVLTAALKAARRVNDFPTAVRIFEGTYMDTYFMPLGSVEIRISRLQFKGWKIWKSRLTAS